ncbi:MAG: IS21-like element helper ATPase IstB [Firmicutes bacterium]|nr:IS21-like element helper ATPase IstB [Bacillota bacterium]MBV1726712.1 IS21-like element helper ATPase IstB [Desulforudis sp.]MBV1734693.1 IS21-like element helper ATPase IstB [Desulforudis sp.]MBV1769794.1 IS21-like element helper ATPase IstB [Desulforudis sp.]MDQ7792610.1 IS21-like element helper ATPase IstB [Clostridia bacterium]
MSVSLNQVKQDMASLSLSAASLRLDDLLTEAQVRELTYQEFLYQLLRHEVSSREARQLEKQLKWAAFPEYKTLEQFDLAEQRSLSKRQLNQLKELHWLEQAYNLILLGPPGVGKTHLAVGLGVEAIRQGYKVRFTQMDELIHVLKTQEITRSARTKLNRLTRSDLVIIDDLMFMAIDRREANLFFQLTNKLYGQTPVIITSNKGPEDWGEILGDPAITTAILDRLIHKSEVISLTGDSYRLKHRKTIFGN